MANEDALFIWLRDLLQQLHHPSFDEMGISDETKRMVAEDMAKKLTEKQ